MKLTKREKEIVYFALSRLLDITKGMDRSLTGGISKEWDKIDKLRDRFKQED